MNKKCMTYCATICCLCVGTINAQSYDALEKRIRVLEEKVANLEAINSLREIPNSSPRQQSTPSAPSKPVTTQRTPAPTQTPVSQPVRTKADLTKLIRARLFKKNLESSSEGKAISLLIAFTNTGRDNIEQFKGTIQLTDMLGSNLFSFTISLDKPIASYDSESWFGEVPFDPANPGYTRAISLNAEEIRTSIIIDEVVFSDGTVQTKD